MASAKRTIDHDEIRRWVDSRGGKPAHVKRTSGGNDPGVLRIDFPGYSGEGTLESLAWDQWFDWFEKNDLAFLYQDEKDSRFSKLVRRSADEEREAETTQRSTAESSSRESGSAQRASGRSSDRGEGQRRKRFSSKTEAVTINDATAEELDALWGVGPKNAERIIAYRRQHGRISGPDDLIAIDGIDGATARTIAQQVDFG